MNNTVNNGINRRAYNRELETRDIRRAAIKSRRHRRVKNTKRFIGAIAVLTIMISIVGFKFVDVEAQKSDTSCMKLAYYSVEINEGDSLWSIASDNYGPGYDNIQDYIDEIKLVNNLSSETIHQGCYIIIPKYIPVK